LRFLSRHDLAGELRCNWLMARIRIRDAIFIDDMDPHDTSDRTTSTDELTTSDGVRYTVTRAEDPYAGLNRAQRRKAMAVEARAHRKAKRGRI
jgi:hypothetical protein